jgi:hypothetical protein
MIFAADNNRIPLAAERRLAAPLTVRPFGQKKLASTSEINVTSISVRASDGWF